MEGWQEMGNFSWVVVETHSFILIISRPFIFKVWFPSEWGREKNRPLCLDWVHVCACVHACLPVEPMSQFVTHSYLRQLHLSNWWKQLKINIFTRRPGIKTINKRLNNGPGGTERICNFELIADLHYCSFCISGGSSHRHKEKQNF